MQTSRRAAQIAKLQERRQEIASKARVADKRPRISCVNFRRTRRRRNASGRPGARSSSGPSSAPHGRRRRTSASAGSRSRSLTRPDDRALFGLDGEPSADAAEAGKTEPAAARPAPITPRQKKLLAKLVEEHPQLARESASTLTSPGLEKLDKAKATSLIGAMLERVNAQVPPDER